MNKLVRTLIELGLTEKEAQIYLASYKLGEATAYEIAKESGLKRPTVYVLMEELRKRGLALVVPHQKKQVYIAKDPHEFIQEYQTRSSSTIKDLLANLPQLSHPYPDTIVFRGTGALAQGLSYGLHAAKNKEVIAFYAEVPKGVRVAQEYLDHSKELHRLGFSLKCIIPTYSNDNDFRQAEKKYGFESRTLPKPIFSPGISIEVCGNAVKTIIHKKREIIVMQDKAIADFYRQIFDIVWSQAK